MSFQLEQDESVEDGVRRVLTREEEKAERKLAEGRPDDEDVFAVRKRFKKARALLKLMRKGLGNRRYRRENACLRDLGRPLTEVRDARMLVESLDGLLEHFSGELKAKDVRPLRLALVQRGDAIHQRVLGNADSLPNLAAEVKCSHDRIEMEALKQDGWPILKAGLMRTYRQGRDAMHEAQANATVKHLHEWCKRARDLRYQLEFLQGACPDVLGEWAMSYHELAQALGDDHDLFVLGEVLKHEIPLPEVESTLKEQLHSLIDRRRRELQGWAIKKGHELYHGDPDAFMREVHQHWKRWRG